MQGRIDGMKDTSDEPLLFHRYFCQFFPRAVSDWFRVLHHEYPKAEYLALPEIKKRDPEYHSLLEKLVDAELPLAEKANVAQEISNKLFSTTK